MTSSLYYFVIVNRCNFTPDFPPPDNSNQFALPTVVLLNVKAEMKPSSPPVCFRPSGGDETVTVLEHADFQTRTKFSLTLAT